jgi:hypothetical protein
VKSKSKVPAKRRHPLFYVCRQILILVGMGVVSVALQVLWASAAGAAPKARCAGVGKPGADQLSFCVDESEESAILQEVARAGKNPRAFLARMEIHAAAAKRMNVSALRQMSDPEVRGAVGQACAKFEGGDLLHYLDCFKSTLGKMEEDLAQLKGVFASDPQTANRGQVLLKQLDANRHFSAKILVNQCGASASVKCFGENLAALHNQLLDAYNDSAVAFDDLARWSILSAACESQAGAGACKSLKKWQPTDFAVRRASLIAYAPAHPLPASASKTPSDSQKKGGSVPLGVPSSAPSSVPASVPQSEAPKPSEPSILPVPSFVPVPGPVPTSPPPTPGVPAPSASSVPPVPSDSAPVLDCSPTAVQGYQTQIRQRVSLFSLPSMIVASAQNYICYVQDPLNGFDSNPQAKFLARSAIHVARAAENFASPDKMTSELEALSRDLAEIRAQSASPELDAVDADLRELLASANPIGAVMGDTELQTRLIRDVCGYKKLVEAGQTGSTAGFFNRFISCRF